MAAKQARFVFREYSGGPPLHSLFVEYSPAHQPGCTLKLLCDYGADFRPAAGWLAEGRPGKFTVRRVEGQTLYCDPAVEVTP